MNYKFFEKTLLKPIMENKILQTLKYQKKNRCNQGYIYTLSSKSNNRIKIGFTKSAKDYEELKSYYEYRLIGRREGTEREFKLLTLTLNEMGYKSNDNESNYLYSKDFIKHLALLGLPVGSFKQLKKKKYFNTK